MALNNLQRLICHKTQPTKQSFYYLKCAYGLSQRELETAEMHTHRMTVRFFNETSLLFCFVLSGPKSSLVYKIFRIPTRTLGVTPPAYTLHVDTPLSSEPPNKFTWRFRRGTTCVRLTLGSKCTSCYATHAAYAARQRNIPVDIQRSFSIQKSWFVRLSYFHWLRNNHNL